ncbi:hypothetical protein COMA2_30187 [Candidatus Nitrospira nitrificans]|uniref:Uncharacterized protein n=1 Tax=Candidatus Nitrospira nitrificans TaxID=1742973 RepID=A0A0S4LQC8_9BACT|nr:hypothetical protein COMA2_30187 [Candidatus Nitrospira nitrificans]
MFPHHEISPYRAGGSSSGRTPAFGAGYLGSIPSPPAISPKPSGAAPTSAIEVPNLCWYCCARLIESRTNDEW